MTMPLEWTHLTAEISERAVNDTRHATTDELVELARTLDILSFDNLVASYAIRPLSAGRFRFEGEYEAKVTQACIVTLDPVPATLTETFSIELHPQDAVDDDATGGDREILSAPDVEPIVDGRIEAGRLIYELVSAALPPYPRKPGAEFDWVDPKDADPHATSPFADLLKIKPKG